ncbi:STAS domain-containing protein [Leptospira sp. GIMC2001]|uniref:STAS domain-containing protein n=1 Tax=Leptospira sp. GIMC2001 TaxID=1513297 RepID=UPI00234B05BC|nr:STAS domain-containing protein [Leptospira sp. GIMC2001]WCL47596.1 STAS domain-containing protein [Leptospira sp. GIMC2001]
MLKSTIINLQGILSADLGSEFYLETKKLFSEDRYLVLLDAQELKSIDEIGIGFLEKTASAAKNSGSQIAICNLAPSLIKIWNESNLESLIPSFQTRSDAIQHLEQFIHAPSQKNTDPSLVYCPACSVLLRIKNFGNNSCPACGNKFYIQQNGHLTSYEKLA